MKTGPGKITGMRIMLSKRKVQKTVPFSCSEESLPRMNDRNETAEKTTKR